METLVDCLGEAANERRRIERFGAQRDGDVDARFAKRRPRALKQRRDEGIGLRPIALVAELEELFELIDEEKKVGAFREVRRAPFNDEAGPFRAGLFEKLPQLLV